MMNFSRSLPPATSALYSGLSSTFRLAVSYSASHGGCLAVDGLVAAGAGEPGHGHPGRAVLVVVPVVVLRLAVTGPSGPGSVYTYSSPAAMAHGRTPGSGGAKPPDPGAPG